MDDQVVVVALNHSLDVIRRNHLQHVIRAELADQLGRRALLDRINGGRAIAVKLDVADPVSVDPFAQSLVWLST